MLFPDFDITLALVKSPYRTNIYLCLLYRVRKVRSLDYAAEKVPLQRA